MPRPWLGERNVPRWPAKIGLGAGMLAAMGLACLLAPILAPHPNRFHFHHLLTPPSWRFPLGTNALGQNVWAQLLAGGRLSLAISTGAVGVELGLALLVGLWAGWWGGRRDQVAMRGIDVLLAFPPLLVATVWAAELGARPLTLVAIVAALGWMPGARVIRAQTLALRQAPFIAATRVLGASEGWILRRHVLPNLLPVVAVTATLQMAYALLTESALSFLGLGVQPPAYDWGSLVGAQQTQLAGAPWLALPGLAIAWTVLAVGWLSQGLQELWAPAPPGRLPADGSGAVITPPAWAARGRRDRPTAVK